MIRVLVQPGAPIGPSTTLAELAAAIEEAGGERCLWCSYGTTTDGTGEPVDCKACEGTGDVVLRVDPAIRALALVLNGCDCCEDAGDFYSRDLGF